jgi:glutaredoxin
MIKLYKTPTCPRCNRVKSLLESLDVKFEVADMTDPASLTELYADGVFALSAPVLYVDGAYYMSEKLCSDEAVYDEYIRKILGR